jgi:hypothetical protein
MKEGVGIFKELEEARDKWSGIIASEIAERNFYDASEMSNYIKARLFIAMSDLLSIQVDDLEKQRTGLIKKYVDKSLPYNKRQEFAGQLAILTPKKKAINRLLHTIQDYNEYWVLKHYITDKFGADVLRDFYANYANNPEYRINKNKHKHQ